MNSVHKTRARVRVLRPILETEHFKEIEEWTQSLELIPMPYFQDSKHADFLAPVPHKYFCLRFTDGALRLYNNDYRLLYLEGWKSIKDFMNETRTIEDIEMRIKSELAIKRALEDNT